MYKELSIGIEAMASCRDYPCRFHCLGSQEGLTWRASWDLVYHFGSDLECSCSRWLFRICKEISIGIKALASCRDYPYRFHYLGSQYVLPWLARCYLVTHVGRDMEVSSSVC